jgi:hypothetical protein
VSDEMSRWYESEIDIPEEECEPVLLLVSDRDYLSGEIYYKIGYMHDEEWFEWRTNEKIENDNVRVVYWTYLTPLPE